VGGGLREIRSEGVNRASCERLADWFCALGWTYKSFVLGQQDCDACIDFADCQ
jgi:hypothetical protein